MIESVQTVELTVETVPVLQKMRTLSVNDPIASTSAAPDATCQANNTPEASYDVTVETSNEVPSADEPSTNATERESNVLEDIQK